MRLIAMVALSILTVVCATPSTAGEPMSGNAIKQTLSGKTAVGQNLQKGVSLREYFAADGTLVSTRPNGRRFTGKWWLVDTGNLICVRFNDFQPDKKFCHRLVADGKGGYDRILEDGSVIIHYASVVDGEQLTWNGVPETNRAAAPGAAAPVADAGPLKFIDTQAQFDPGDFNFSGALRTMRKEMERVGISKTLIVPPPFADSSRATYDAEEIIRVIGSDTVHFGFLAGGGSLNVTIQRTAPADVTDEVKRKFRERCEKILALGALGFGEVTASHLSLPGMGSFHPSESAPPDHPLLLLLADIAAEHDVPIDIHFDIFPAVIPTPPNLRHNNPSELKENRQAFERLLAHNPKARFNWAHVGSDPAGQRTPRLMRELLMHHPNLYSAFRVTEAGPKAVQPLDEAEQLKPVWRKLILDFPDRFTMHTDIFYVSHWPPDRGPKKSHELAQKLLAQLPPEIARQLAYENTKRIYRMKD